MSMSIQASQTDTEQYANYWEEVRKLVDGIISEVLTGTIKSQGQAIHQLVECVKHSSYVDPRQTLCMQTLQYSENANAWFAQFAAGSRGFQEFMLERMAGFSALKNNNNSLSGDFPFSEMAEAAMQADALSLLRQEGRVNVLPAVSFPVDIPLFVPQFEQHTEARIKTYRSSSTNPNLSNTGKPDPNTP